MSMPGPHPEYSTTSPQSSRSGERGYPLLFFYLRSSWGYRLLAALLVCALSGAFYIWYSQSGYDTTPDSWAGLGYATFGTIFLILAAVLYSIRRRLRKRAIGQLNASLHWHVLLAIVGLIVLFMHAFGHFAMISGTFALYSMAALTISGFVGRILDHVMPRLIAREVDKVLTRQGDDGVESTSQKLRAVVVHNTQENRGIIVSQSQAPIPMPGSLPFTTNGQSLGTSWDLAYISLEPTQQELDQNAPHYRFIPDKKSALNRPGALMPGAEEHLSALQDMQLAMRREQFFRYIIRYWRVLHILLAFITIGLVTWHIIFASTILWPRFFH
ncbi:MAG: hypothetical protein E6I79_03945 [Chloroflexi bacterium]|nr:MAG: hypothetical protein E6I79_03945 [Chloroflexota bacterium]